LFARWVTTGQHRHENRQIKQERRTQGKPQLPERGFRPTRRYLNNQR
jgi:hypothetical protein